MPRTIFETPVVNTFLRSVASICLTISRWRVAGTLPREPRYVMVAAPHTSNWDLPIMLMIALTLRARVCWMGKDAIFRFPFGHVMRWLGGVPVVRSHSTKTVARMAKHLQEADSIALVIAPEGTRSSVTKWKTGFYHIALDAGVPIVLGFLDYSRRVGGIGPTIRPSGDLEADMDIIRRFYRGITGKYAAESKEGASAVES